MVTPMALRDSAKSDVIVIGCDTGPQPIIPLLPAYTAAIYDNPSRSWFKNHRVGFWIATGQSLNKVLPLKLGLEPQNLGLDAIRQKWEDYLQKDKTAAPAALPALTELAAKVLEGFDPNQLAMTRFVLVVPADAKAPEEGAWGKACVDVVLVAAQHDTAVEDLNDWVAFCSGRGLLSLLRPAAPAPSTGAAPSAVAVARRRRYGWPAPGSGGASSGDETRTDRKPDVSKPDANKQQDGAPADASSRRTAQGLDRRPSPGPGQRAKPADRVAKVDPMHLVFVEGYDLRLVNDPGAIPAEGKRLIIVALNKDVLRFRIFDGEGKVVVDTDEKRLTKQAQQLGVLREQLKNLWPPHVLTRSEKDWGVAAVTSIVPYTLLEQLKRELIRLTQPSPPQPAQGTARP